MLGSINFDYTKDTCKLALNRGTGTQASMHSNILEFDLNGTNEVDNLETRHMSSCTYKFIQAYHDMHYKKIEDENIDEVVYGPTEK